MGQKDAELQKLRQGFDSNRRVLLPSISVLVCLLAIQFQRLEPFKPLVLYMVLHGVAVVLFEWWADAAASLQLLKARLQVREFVSISASAIGYYICTTRSSPENEVLMKFVSLVLIPMLVVHLSEEFGLPAQFALLVHFLSVCIRLRHSLWGEGGQQVIGLLIFHALLFKVGIAQEGASGSSDVVRSMFNTLSSMLSIMCDGFLIIDKSDKIIAVSGGAELCLGSMSGPDGNDLNGERFSTLFDDEQSAGSAAMGRPKWGLTSVWFKRPDKKRIKLETYTVPCWLSTEHISQLLDGTPFKAGLGQGAYICAIRIVEEEKKRPPEPEPAKPMLSRSALEGHPFLGPSGVPDASLGPPSLGSLGMASLESPLGSKATLAPLFFRSGERFFSPQGSYRKVEVPGCEDKRGGWIAAENASGERVAIKEISLAGMGCQRDFPVHLRAISREADALKKISWASPVVIRLNDCWLQSDFAKACLVTEWLPNTLEHVLQKSRTEGLVSTGKQDARRWFAHMIAGVSAIHAAGFVHRDIKPSNIWLTEDLQRAKIAGLGISRPLRRKSVYGKTSNRRGSFDDDADSAVGGARSDISGLSEDNCSMVSGLTGLTVFTALNGINAYSSPEMLNDRRYTEQTDIFSLGCILLEMLTLAPIGEMGIGSQGESSPEETAWSLVADTRVRCFEVHLEVQWLSVNCSMLPSIGISMLSLEPSKRPVANDLVTRSARLQEHLRELIEESPKLRGVLLKQSRRVHFNAALREHDVEDEDKEIDGDSSSELAPAVA
mmetsp:Transcript_72946/g.201319  ORF Transcript_72946/g.201319 Transcript_72946/m.201319 type:complete len:777 (-) Transcript_72946:481-2811(-)